jgi:dipeptidyl aminopeptidase/acylaminoacyl peptidase
VAAASWAVAHGAADPERLAIRGGSAGGFTALAALCFHDRFAAGCSRYGIGDLAALAADTHKFESRYTDRLVAPWPEGREVYRARSPLYHVDGLDRPVLFFQGLDDRVVPPRQTEAMVAALARRGVPHAYVAFAGEGHGFRRAETLVACLEGELHFYGRVFGFDAGPAPAGFVLRGA